MQSRVEQRLAEYLDFFDRDGERAREVFFRDCADGWAVSYTTTQVEGGPDEGKFLAMASKPIGKGARRVNVRGADAGAALPALLRLLGHGSIGVTCASVRRPSLDDVFLDLTGRRLEESGDATDVGTDEPIGATRA